MKVFQRPLGFKKSPLFFLILATFTLGACSGQGVDQMMLEGLETHNIENNPGTGNRGAPTIVEVGPDTEGPQEIHCAKTDPDCEGGFLVVGGKEATPIPQEPIPASRLALGGGFAPTPLDHDSSENEDESDEAQDDDGFQDLTEEELENQEHEDENLEESW